MTLGFLWRVPVLLLILAVLLLCCGAVSVLLLLAGRPEMIPEIWARCFGWQFGGLKTEN